MTSVAISTETLDLMAYIEEGTTACFAVAETARRLANAGFVPLEEGDAWNLHPGDACYVIREDSSIIAFRVGEKPAGEAGFHIVGSHTDSPGFRLKPNATYTKSGYRQLGVEVYGGPLLASWTDRDLTLAGKVFLEGSGNGGLPNATLVRFESPLCRIPQVAIHLNRGVNDDGLKLNKQDHLPPIVGLATEEGFEELHLRQKLAERLGVQPEDIAEYRLELVDTQKAALGGFDNEFYFSPRIDNLAGCHSAITSLIRAGEKPQITQVAALFDAEEIGSTTLNGAASNFIEAVLERIAGSRDDYLRSCSKSIFISSDGAHALHPNYAAMHDPNHTPALNGGPVIKFSALERYASRGSTAAYFKSLCKKAGVPCQVIVGKTDIPSGSTIGPMSSARLGMPTIDVGIPMLSMHSVRETAGVLDQDFMIRALIEHFNA